MWGGFTVTEYIQLNEDGDLIVFDDGVWTGKCCICECSPKILARYLLHPNTSWDLTPYQEIGFAKPAPYKRRWQLRECTGGIRYGEGQILNDGTLVGLPDKFDAKYSYNGYMTLQMCCVNPQTGALIEPDCETW